MNSGGTFPYRTCDFLKALWFFFMPSDVDCDNEERAVRCTSEQCLNVQAIREEFGARAAALAATRAPAVGLEGIPLPCSACCSTLLCRSKMGGGGVGASGGGGGASYDFTFPVEFGSQKFSLSWNRGEDPKAVAERFIRWASCKLEQACAGLCTSKEFLLLLF